MNATSARADIDRMDTVGDNVDMIDPHYHGFEMIDQIGKKEINLSKQSFRHN